MELTISGDFADRILSLLKKDKGLATSLAGEWLERVDNTAIAEYLLTQDIAVELLAGRLVASPESTVKELQALAAGESVKASAAPKRPKVKASRKKATKKKAAKKSTKKAAKKATKKAATKKATTKKAAKKATKKATTKKAAKKATKKAAKKGTRKATKKKATKKATRRGRPGVQRRTRLPKDQIAGLKDDVVSYLGSVSAASRKQIIEAANIPTPAIYNRIVGELREEGVVGSEGQKAKAVYFLKKGKRSKAKGKKRR